MVFEQKPCVSYVHSSKNFQRLGFFLGGVLEGIVEGIGEERKGGAHAFAEIRCEASDKNGFEE